MAAMASQITSFTIVYSTVYSGVDQRKYQSSASLAFVRGIHRWPVNSPHKGPVTRNVFPFDDVIIYWLSAWYYSDHYWLFNWTYSNRCQRNGIEILDFLQEKSISLNYGLMCCNCGSLGSTCSSLVVVLMLHFTCIQDFLKLNPNMFVNFPKLMSLMWVWGGTSAWFQRDFVFPFYGVCFNSLRFGDAYMRQRTLPSFFM